MKTRQVLIEPSIVKKPLLGMRQSNLKIGESISSMAVGKAVIYFRKPLDDGLFDDYS